MLELILRYKTIVQFVALAIIFGYGGDWVLKKKFGIDLWWKIKAKIGSRMYPVRVVVLQQLFKKSWQIFLDRERRTEKKGNEVIKSLRTGTEMSPIDYSSYIPDKEGHKWMLALDVDEKSRIPLRPLVYSDIFVYDRNGKLFLENNSPVLKEDFKKGLLRSDPDTTIGLHALSKDRKRWLVQGIKEDAIKHQEKHDSKMIIGAIGLIIIMAVIGMAIFWQVVPQAAAEAGKQVGTAVP